MRTVAVSNVVCSLLAHVAEPLVPLQIPPPANSKPITTTATTTTTTTPTTTRRTLLFQNAVLATATTAAVWGGSSPASASLLDEFGTDPTKIQQQPTSNDKASTTSAVVSTAKPEGAYEPNLRSNYYYPTNKKRYLPRIKKCNDAIPQAADSIGAEDWAAVREFAETIADDTILPLKLYTSSLTGGGTNVKVSYTKDLFRDADIFEKNQKLLLKAVTGQDQTLASTALEGMASALQDYRVTANLTGPDGGGDIPSVDDIRRAARRLQGRTYEQKVLARDARLKQPPPPGNVPTQSN